MSLRELITKLVKGWLFTAPRSAMMRMLSPHRTERNKVFEPVRA
jgi:hypothetical protein